MCNIFYTVKVNVANVIVLYIYVAKIFYASASDLKDSL